MQAGMGRVCVRVFFCSFHKHPCVSKGKPTPAPHDMLQSGGAFSIHMHELAGTCVTQTKNVHLFFFLYISSIINMLGFFTI